MRFECSTEGCSLPTDSHYCGAHAFDESDVCSDSAESDDERGSDSIPGGEGMHGWGLWS